MRNKHAGLCYQCGLRVEPSTGHFERHDGGWRVKHANVPGHGRVTCEGAGARPVPCMTAMEAPTLDKFY